MQEAEKSCIFRVKDTEKVPNLKSIVLTKGFWEPRSNGHCLIQSPVSGQERWNEIH
jgi:hypothetical protein